MVSVVTFACTGALRARILRGEQDANCSSIDSGVTTTTTIDFALRSHADNFLPCILPQLRYTQADRYSACSC
jgi:hypothetical protein